MAQILDSLKAKLRKALDDVGSNVAGFASGVGNAVANAYAAPVSLLSTRLSNSAINNVDANTQAKVKNALAIRQANQSGNKPLAIRLASQGRQLGQMSEGYQQRVNATTNFTNNLRERNGIGTQLFNQNGSTNWKQVALQAPLQGVKSAAYTYGLASGAIPQVLGSRLGLGILGASTLLGDKNKSFGQRLGEAVGNTPYYAGFSKMTNPLVAKGLGKIGVQANSSGLLPRVGAGVANVAQGAAMNVGAGQAPINPLGAAVDFAAGAAFGPGQFGDSAMVRKKLDVDSLNSVREAMNQTLDYHGHPAVQQQRIWENIKEAVAKVNPKAYKEITTNFKDTDQQLKLFRQVLGEALQDQIPGTMRFAAKQDTLQSKTINPSASGEVSKANRPMIRLTRAGENKPVQVMKFGNDVSTTTENALRVYEKTGDRQKAADALIQGFEDEGVVTNYGRAIARLNEKIDKYFPSSPKGNYTGQVTENGLSGSEQVPVPPRGGITIRTTANSEISSAPSIDKGKLNINRLNVKGAGKKVLLAQEAQMQPTVIGNKEIVAAARTAKGTGPLTDEQMKKMIANQLKNRQVVVDLTKQYNQAKQSGASEIELGRIMLQIAEQSRTARQGGAFAGRILQAQNIIADQSASPMQKIFALLDNAGVKEKDYLKDAVKVDWDKPAQVVGFYRKYVPPKFGEILDEVRYTNMLSSPLTHITNIVGNALQTAVVAPVEKTITGALDWGKSLLTGSERKYYTSAGIDYAGGYVKALPQAISKAWGVLSGQDVSIRPDYEQIPIGSTGLLKAYSTPLRALEAMDQFFRTLVEGGVTNELRKSPQFGEPQYTKIKVYPKNPVTGLEDITAKPIGTKEVLRDYGAEIADRASKEADYRLFRQAFDPEGKLGQGGVLQLFDKWNSAIGNLRRLPGGRWVLPFLQTPTNILKQGVEYSPLGAATAIGAKNPLEQLSKAIIGTAVFTGAYSLAKGGLVSWGAPSGEKERELYYAAGMQPYSVKVGNNWVSFSKLGPLSYPFAMAAALADAEKRNPDQSYVSNVGRSISGMLAFFGDQSYVRSIGDLVEAIQGGVSVGPSAISAEAANLAGQLVPYKSFLTWLGRITDPTYYKANSFSERMVKDLPVVGSKLEPYTNMDGQPSVRDYPILNAVSPFKVTQEKAPASQLLEQYQQKKIENAVQKRADEAFARGDKTKQKTGNLYRYIDDSGAVKTIDLSFPVGTYTSTGNKTLDKELLSDYKSSITKVKNEVMKALEVGAITQDEAVAQLESLQGLTNATAKGKKIKVGAPTKLKSIQIKTPAKLQLAQVSLPKPKLIRLAPARQQRAKIKIRTLPKAKLSISKTYGKNS